MSEEKNVKLSSRILKALGLFLMIVFVIIMYIGFISNPMDLNLIILGMSGLFISVLLQSLAAKGVVKPEFVMISEIKCSSPKCDFHKFRLFKEGDYVYKKFGVCERCSTGKMIIQNIIQMNEKEAKKIISNLK
ncbi:MAG: hypothetical protein ACTSQO_14050 [Candidatus Helarchaeota archaeon]